ncbi:MAG: response regulator transcription factor [Thermoleophilaceae bacterium]
MEPIEIEALPQPEGQYAPHGIERPVGRPRVAIIGTDRAFVQVLLNRVDRLGWQSSVHETPPDTRDLLGLRLSAVVVDPEVLQGDVFEFIERVGHEAPELALVVVSAGSSARDRVRGLHLGADDWVQKPCHPDEVAARIEAILRRARRATSRLMTAPSVSGELEIDLSRFQAYVGEQSLDFTRREFEVLRLLAGAVGKVLTREEIYEQVWGYRMAHGDRSVDVFVRKVRQKLEKASPAWTYIHTHFGLGYRFEPAPRG